MRSGTALTTTYSEHLKPRKTFGPNNKMRVMFVDDDLDMLPLYELAGRSEDTLITIQTGGISALKFLDRLDYQVDAIVCDLSMPDMDGITLTRQIRRNEDIRGVEVPIDVFWFTGYNLGPTILAAKERYNVREVFVKPMDPVEIIARVKSYFTIPIPMQENGAN